MGSVRRAVDLIGSGGNQPELFVPPPNTPEWIEPTFRFTAGLDPIGLRALTAGRIVAPLTPAVLALSDRARYLSFYAWLLRRYAEQRRPLSWSALGKYILAREYEFGLAVRLCPNGCGASPVGQQRVGPAVNRRPEAYERGESVKSDLGGYGLYYRTPMQALELVRPPGTMLGEHPVPIDVLNRAEPRALELAAAYEAAVGGTAYVQSHMDADGLIPAESLIEFAAVGCLCRLPDHVNERDLLRTAYLEWSPGQSREDVARRREAFALYLDQVDQGIGLANDDAFRAGIWNAFQRETEKSAAAQATLARWAALTAIHAAQDGINVLWVAGGRALRHGATGDGFDWPTVQGRLKAMVPAAALDMPGGVVQVEPDGEASSLFEQVAQATNASGLTAVVEWARRDLRPAAGVALILSVVAQLPNPDDAERAWLDVAAVNGDWQPGLLVMAGRIRERLASGDTVGDLAQWLFEHLVLRPHESNAYSKLPDFTFRWRWESGRLRFYDHPIDWDALGDIRSAALASLATDLGFLDRGDARARVSADGLALIGAVFGS